MLPFLLQHSTFKGNRVEKKKNLSISYHSAILNGSQYLYIMLSTLQYHYRLNSAGCKKYHSEHKAYNSSNEKRVISVFQLEWKIKITKALSSKENWQIKGTKNKIFMAHIVKWKVNNLRWTIMWEIALFLKSKKANLTNTHIHIPASWACSYMYMCTNMQVMVDVQQCWGIDIFSPILIFKIFSSETVKLTSTALYEEGWFFFFFLSPA